MLHTLLLLACVSASFADDSASVAIQEFVRGNNLFTQDLYKQLAAPNNNNFLVSPFSVEVVLALAQSGAKNQTAQELSTALHLPEKDKIATALKIILPELKQAELLTLQTANRIYVDKSLVLKEEFKTTASQVYRADVEPIEFSKNVEAAQSINQWVEKQTNSKIKDLIKSNDLSADTKAVLINALYLKANWSHPFHSHLTQKKKFFKTESETVEVDFLHQYDKRYRYFECPHLKVQILELPFQGGDVSLVLVLPAEKTGLSAIEDRVNEVFASEHQLETTNVNVAIPKFKVETSIDIKEILQNLGVKSLFSPGEADLSGIAGEKGELNVDKVAQKTFIDVDEKGVEAAAATYLEIMRTYAIISREEPKNFNADHPFIFFIRAKSLILFAGRVTDPSKT